MSSKNIDDPTHDFFKIYSFEELEVATRSEVATDATFDDSFPAEGDDFLVVNGQYQPTILLAPGEKKVFRSVFAAGAGHPKIEIEGDACTMMLIAADGVYLDTPRTVDQMVYVPGTRYDTVIWCDTAGTYHLTLSVEIYYLDITFFLNNRILGSIPHFTC